MCIAFGTLLAHGYYGESLRFPGWRFNFNRISLSRSNSIQAYINSAQFDLFTLPA